MRHSGNPSWVRRLKQGLKSVAWRVAPIPALWKHRPVTQNYSIAICQGDSLLSLRESALLAKPVLTRLDVTDVPANLVADPFFCRHGGRWYMFFEVYNNIRSCGEIGLAESEDGLSWQYRQIVLREPFHLSYPYVFEWDQQLYMIPEGGRGSGVTLYRATEFPIGWQPVRVLLEQRGFFDSSIFHYQGRWWLFSATRDGDGQPALHLYHADDPLGDWAEHPMSPVVKGDPHITRPGGRVIVDDGRLYRFAQDSYPIYGSKVHLLEITRLTTSEYAEARVLDEPYLEAGEFFWNNNGMHHVDARRLDDGTWLACVDGFPRRHRK